MLSLYRRLTWFRRGCNALSRGDYAAIDGTPLGVFAYIRTFGDERVLVALNFTGGELALTLPEDVRLGEMVISTHADGGAAGVLRANEGRVYRVL